MLGENEARPADRTAFVAALEAVGDPPAELARRMDQLGDNRSIPTILRSIQRMMSGEVRVSGEMAVIVELLLQQRKRVEQVASLQTWTDAGRGCLTTVRDGFTVTLAPETRGRWRINLVHTTGYSPSWPKWQDNVDAAKIKAMMCVEDGLIDVDRIQRENRAIA